MKSLHNDFDDIYIYIYIYIMWQVVTHVHAQMSEFFNSTKLCV